MNNDNETYTKSMKTFMVIWVGQLISILGSGITGFGIGVWIFAETGDATPFALIALAYNLPRILLSPAAGSAADRYDRKKIMILADTGAALMTAVIAVLIFSDSLEVWHIYITAAFSSVFGSFQDPAYRASITMMVPKKDLARAGGIQQIGGAVQSILVPILAAGLYAAVGLKGVIIIDFVTYFFAVGALFLVHIPMPERVTDVEEAGAKPSMWRDAVFGWKYLRDRPGLFGLLWYYAAVNFFLNSSGVLWAPMILSFGTEVELGVSQMSAGVGMLLGGLLMGTWGGPKKRRVWGVIITIALSSFGYLIASLQPNIYFVATGQFVIMFFIPISAALSQAVWQTKVAPDVQGRVFAIRSMIAYSMIPIANLMAGLLADNYFEPRMQAGGAMADSALAGLIGVGAGRGIAVMFIISGVTLIVLSAVIFTRPKVRDVEEHLPDAIPDDPEEEETPDLVDEPQVEEEAVSPVGAS